MAPRTAKAKKTAEVKVAENEAPKKGRGKGKHTEEIEQEVPEVEIDDKPAQTDKKTKRGKKAQENGDAQTNGTAEEAAPPAKRGRKKKEAELESVPEDKSTSDHSVEEETAVAEEQNGDHTESNDTEDAQPVATGKGRKKAAKKEEKPKETAKGRKAKQASPEAEEKEDKVVEEKPKSKGRGRKPKAEATPEPEVVEEKTEPAEEAKVEPAAKGRKKAQPKTVKEKSPEPEESPEETDKQDEQEEKPEASKKETKGRKGKKAQAKEEGESEEKEPASKKRKVTKKEEKGQGDVKDEEVVEDGEDEVEEAKPAKGKRGKKAEPAQETDEEPADAEAASKRRRKPADDKAPAEDKKKAAQNKAATNYAELDFSNHSKNSHGKEWNFKIACWNVDGIRAWLNKGGLDYIKHEKPDILCLQETKCAKKKLPEELANLPGYHAYWVDSDKDGYAGVGLYTTRLAMNVHYGLGNKELDDEGRIITAEYEQFYLICVYVPNAGRKLVSLPKRLQWNQEFRKLVKELDKNKPVIICGDMNVAHNEIDLTNPKTNRRNAGFTDEERAGMTELLADGFVDTFRHFYPDKAGAYTFWTYMMGARAKNVGWRLDYFIVSERLLPAVCDNVIRDRVYGSDHCPITLFLHLTSADKPKEA